MQRKRNAWWIVAQIAIAALVVWFAWRTLAPDWPAVVDAFRTVSFKPGPLALSILGVLVSYAILIETWRRVVSSWGSHLSPGVAARIWFVSNLGRYLPGKVWAITAMGTMAHRAGVSPAAAVGSSLLIAVINVVAAFAVVLLTVPDALPIGRAGAIAIGTALVATALAPRFIPGVAGWIGARFGRTVTWPTLPQSTIIVAYAGCALAWVIYGLAFHALSIATLGTAGGAPRYSIAVFVASYIAGYVFLPAPGGLGVREAWLGALLKKFGMTAVAGAALLVVVSRVWLTILELLPGLILLAFDSKRTAPHAPDV
ncbi:MAG TPA: lysylphosphatidylglycerol synthase domain-containing protein [Gemmatimonadaceae bacterium]|nr:lysylphosphatidylglycerol synthase domain-containing protein [Gemmatimonadaceae bacterium]